jgi:hypothetical protein
MLAQRPLLAEQHLDILGPSKQRFIRAELRSDLQAQGETPGGHPGRQCDRRETAMCPRHIHGRIARRPQAYGRGTKRRRGDPRINTVVRHQRFQSGSDAQRAFARSRQRLLGN